MIEYSDIIDSINGIRGISKKRSNITNLFNRLKVLEHYKDISFDELQNEIDTLTSTGMLHYKNDSLYVGKEFDILSEHDSNISGREKDLETSK